MNSDPSLGQVKAVMRDRGVTRLLAKWLAPNDNSKNQIYLGGDFGVLNIIPTSDPVAATSGTKAEPIFKAALTLSWISPTGDASMAPSAQLILYPQYPEVRMSGFLKGARWAPSALLTVRDEGRVLLLGVTDVGTIFAYVTNATSRVANELRSIGPTESIGVFQTVNLDTHRSPANSRRRLLTALCEISRGGWIEGWTLSTDGTRRPCTASNCVGVTLESELGITANGRSEPDFEGWEVKAHTVANLARPGSAAVTLMTPEPTGGIYTDAGVVEFVRRFGYSDRTGREDRHNFGGIHRVGEVCSSTGLTLQLDGYDHERQKLVRTDGELALVNKSGVVAASWNFAGLLAHWRRKHARAAYVPAIRRIDPNVAFQFGSNVLLAEGTDYTQFLAALAEKAVYYDPGIKVERWSTKPKVKRRSQFRVSRARLSALYHSSEQIESCAR